MCKGHVCLSWRCALEKIPPSNFIAIIQTLDRPCRCGSSRKDLSLKHNRPKEKLQVEIGFYEVNVRNPPNNMAEACPLLLYLLVEVDIYS